MDIYHQTRTNLTNAAAILIDFDDDDDDGNGLLKSVPKSGGKCTTSDAAAEPTVDMFAADVDMFAPEQASGPSV